MPIDRIDVGWKVVGRSGGGVFGAIAGSGGSLDVALDQAARDLRLATLLDAAGGPGERRVQSMRQVHGPDAVTVSAASRLPGLPDCDALLTRSGEAAAAGVTADCVPLILLGPGIAAAVHAGWKGLACGVVDSAVAACAGAGGCRPDQLEAFIGPCAGACCYEVGDEVIEAVGHGAVHDGRMFDSAATAAAQLGRLGVGSAETVDVCTICSPPTLLASFRRDGEGAGRQGFIAWSS